MNYKTLNAQWLEMMEPSYGQFCQQAAHFEESQAIKLQRYMSANAATQYGIKYGFKSIGDYTQYIDRVPILEDWTLLLPYIEYIEAGGAQVLTQENLVAFEETSGSTAYSKLIPFTPMLQQEFQAAVSVWMHSSFQHFPHAFEGRAFWSISPPMKPPRISPSGLPIGLPSDLAYFEPQQAALLSQIMAFPEHLLGVRDREIYYFELLTYLLLQEDLTFMSIWSPSYVLQLHRFMGMFQKELLASVKNKVSAQRFKAFSGRGTWKELWPQLALVSCWTDAQAQSWMPELLPVLGDVPIQPKGLMSTEGISSFPYHPQHDPVLAFTSHFYEFREKESQQVCLPQEVEKGKKYEVILSTGGGLYRYATGDIVQITGHIDSLPCMKFLGRKGKVSDLVGEKISEYQVIEAFSAARKQWPLSYAWLYPEQRQTELIYHFLIEGEGNADLLHTLVSHLTQNPYVRQAMDAHQISGFRLVTVADGFHDKILDLLKTQRNIKDGDAKLPVLLQPRILVALLGF